MREAIFGPARFPARFIDAVNVQNQGDGARWRFKWAAGPYAWPGAIIVMTR